ncbi:hypothetical protein OF83DRAFT_1172242 [Amylostereum chailletii]|nr:hypothetical protein OF83DRAFT_1172242 [Amylostereum chailletii]
MATVHAPPIPRHPSPFAKRNPPRPQPSSSSGGLPDPFYGQEQVAKICARFVSHLFACPELPPAGSATTTAVPSPRLDTFIAYALHRTRLHVSVTFAALYLLQRLKARFPAAKGSSGHRLFISAFMLASKIICDDTYSNKSWCIVVQGMFALREINQMEREMCSYLEWQLNVDPTVLREFETRVRRDFSSVGPYPPLLLPTPASDPSPSNPTFFGSSMPSSAASASSSPSAASTSSAPATIPYPTIPPPAVYTLPPPPSIPSPSSSPSTPESSRSTSTSPASSISPPTPPDTTPGYDVKIVGDKPHGFSRYDTGNKIRRSSHASLDAAYAQDSRSYGYEHGDAILACAAKKQSPSRAAAHAHSKGKAGKDMFAFATRTVW